MEKCSENNEEMTEAILAFDMLYTTNHMKILKLLIPFLESEYQKKLAVYIKWQELMFTLNFLKKYSASLYSPDFKQSKSLNLNTLLPMLTPYCNESEKKIISQLVQAEYQRRRGFLYRVWMRFTGRRALNRESYSKWGRILSLLGCK